MKNKAGKVILALFIIILVVFIGSFINAFYGNPISAAIATSKIRAYVEETYPGLNLVIPKATYNFKFNEYNCHIKSEVSEDTRFDVSWSKGGIHDSYEYEVAKCYTTLQRIGREFNKAVEEILVDKFPYNMNIMFADFGKNEEDLSNLTLDMKLDLQNPPMPAYLTVYILSEDVSYEFLSNRLLELYQLMEGHRIPISTYTLVIEEPHPEGGEKADPLGESNHLIDFPVEKMTSGDLIETIKAHQKDWEKEHER